MLKSHTYLVATVLDSEALKSIHIDKHFYHINTSMEDCNQCDLEVQILPSERVRKVRWKEENRQFVSNSISHITDIPGGGGTKSKAFVYRWTLNAPTSYDSLWGKG